MKNKKLFFLAAVIFIFGLLADAGPALANCATGENDPGCYGSVSLGQSCGTGKTCQQESCGESWVYSCLTAPTSTAASGGTTTSGSVGEGGSCTTDSNCKTGLNCYLKAECKDGSCMDSICSTKTPTGTDYCSGGDCALSTCTIARPAITGGSCGDSSKQCCATEQKNTNGDSYGVLANTDNCSGTCRTSCASAGETGSTNMSEYCGTDGYECCVIAQEYTCSANGGTCKGDMCFLLAGGYESVSGTCPSGESCCKETSSKGTYSIDWERETPSSGAAWNAQSAGKFGLPSGTISGIIESLLMWLLGIFGFLGIITFVIAGIFYLTAAGDAEMEKKAKNAMKMGIIGIVVGLVGFVVIKAVDLLLNAGTSF